MSTGRGHLQGITWDRKNNLFLVADANSSELLWFDPKHEKIEKQVQVQGPDGSEMAGVAYRRDTNDLYVVFAGGKHPSYCNVFGGFGKLEDITGRCDSEDIDFMDEASDFAFGYNNQEFVLDPEHEKIVELDDDDWDFPEDEYKLDKIKNPTGFAAKSDRIYVVSADSEIVVYEWR